MSKNQAKKMVGRLRMVGNGLHIGMETILDSFPRIKTVNDLAPYIIEDLHLSDHQQALLDVLTELKNMFAKLPHPHRKKIIPDVAK